jgi:uncharacterized membrane protein
MEGTIREPITTARQPARQPGRFDMNTLVGYILLLGVLLSMVLILLGEIWHWANTGSLALDYSISGHSFFGFLLSDFRELFSGVFRPRLLTSFGIAVLLLTPYIRVLASMIYFVIGEHNLKYTLFTLFVFGVLTYTLFLR